jgi:hypothetical protein
MNENARTKAQSKRKTKVTEEYSSVNIGHRKKEYTGLTNN